MKMTDEVLELLNEIKEGKLETSLKQVLTVNHFLLLSCFVPE